MNQWKWCVTDSDGKVIKGWYKDTDGLWYHLNEETGVLDIGWFQDTRDNNKWYYLCEEDVTNYGIEYKVGSMIMDWFKIDGKWYYFIKESNPSQGECKGQMILNCTRTINGKNYSFDEWGHMLNDSNSLVSDDCINFVKSFEGFFPNKYYDCVGVLTQGYGMTGSEISNLPDEITEETASNMLKDLINKNYAQVIKDDLDSKGVTLKQNEFDALVSFAYNCGTDALLNQSTLYKNVCKGIRDYNTILGNFQSWSNGGGKRIEGLYRRRTKEALIFLNSNYTGNV